MRNKNKNSAFTLLEVMVATLILGMSMAVLFSSEGGSIKMALRSRKVGTASLMARCKMGEIEEQIAAEGFPAEFASGSDGCCENAEIDGFSCEWEINAIIMPETMFPDEMAEGTTTEEDMADPLSFFSQEESEDGLLPDIPGYDESMEDPVAAFGADIWIALYPLLRSIYEEQIRRVDLTVKWYEGDKEHSFGVTQFLVGDKTVMEGQLPGT